MHRPGKNMKSDRINCWIGDHVNLCENTLIIPSTLLSFSRCESSVTVPPELNYPIPPALTLIPCDSVSLLRFPFPILHAAILPLSCGQNAVLAISHGQ